MNSASNHVDGIADFLGAVRRKGVRLWSQDGRLHYKAPKGALSTDEVERLRGSRSEILTLMERASVAELAEPKLERRPTFDRAPLSFAQLARWYLHQLDTRPALRQIVSALRLRGRLDVSALQSSVTEIVRRHDALRTRIVIRDGVPSQEISASADSEIRLDDLRTAPEGLRDAETIRIIEQHILKPIDFAVGPLCGVRLVRLRDEEHVLIVAMDHMISDMFSLNILLRELFTAYTQALTGGTFSLSAIPIQFPDYAAWQRSMQDSWVERHGAYWERRLRECRRLRFPEDPGVQGTARSGWGRLPARIEKGFKMQLQEWCRLRKTTPVMAVLTAYAALVLRWCGEAEAVIQFQSDGRVSSNLDSTIGFFASALYIRVALLEEDDFLDLMQRVTEEYCRAYEHADFSYLAARVPRPEFTHNSVFNWVPPGSKLDFSPLDGSQHALVVAEVEFEHPALKSLQLDNEPAILFHESQGELVADIYFPLQRFSVPTMEKFAGNFVPFVRTLLTRPETRVRDMQLSA